MNQNQTESKPQDVEEPRDEGLDETACSAVCFRSATTKAWHLYSGNAGKVDRLAFQGVVYKPERKMSIREACALPGPFEAECFHQEALAFLKRVDAIVSPNVKLCQPCPPSTPPSPETAAGQGLA